MHLHPAACGVGAVYLSGGRYFVVLACANGRAVTATVEYANRPRLRNDVPVDDISALSAMGLPGGSWLIRCARMAVVPQPTVTVLGQIAPAMMATVSRAASQEATARALENKYRVAEV